MRKLIFYFPVLALIFLITNCATHKNNHVATSISAPGIAYALDIKDNPRPLRIHILSVSLTNQSYNIEAIIADDPDGDGRAEAKLTPPLTLAKDAKIIAAINANAFEDFTLKKGQKPIWSRNLPVDIKGWAFNEKRTASNYEKGYGSFWIDKSGRVKIGYLEENEKVNCLMAVSGFSPLILNGKVLNSTDKSLHPRTAVGINEEKNELIFVVVDGRQKNYSEGMSLQELAEYMARLGCNYALNLDGGGSSIMIVRNNSGKKVVVNSPCSRPFRPIPVMLAVKVK